MAEKKKKNKSTPKAEIRSEDKPHKSTAEEPDEFVAGVNRWAVALKPHVTKITVAVIALFVVGMGLGIYQWMGGRKARAATSEIAAAMAIADRPVVEPDPDTPPATDPDAIPPFPSREARAKAVLEALSGDGLPGPRALLKTRALMDSGRYDDAARAFSTAAGTLSAEGAVAARIAIGYAYEAKAESTDDPAGREAALNEALDAFRTSQPAENGLRRDVAMFHEARILAVLGKRDDAVAAYAKILETKPDTELKAEIEGRMQRLGKN